MEKYYKNILISIVFIIMLIIIIFSAKFIDIGFGLFLPIFIIPLYIYLVHVIYYD
jgi:hypothetical protein